MGVVGHQPERAVPERERMVEEDNSTTGLRDSTQWTKLPTVKQPGHVVLG